MSESNAKNKNRESTSTLLSTCVSTAAIDSDTSLSSSSTYNASSISPTNSQFSSKSFKEDSNSDSNPSRFHTGRCGNGTSIAATIIENSRNINDPFISNLSKSSSKSKSKSKSKVLIETIHSTFMSTFFTYSSVSIDSPSASPTHPKEGSLPALSSQSSGANHFVTNQAQDEKENNNFEKDDDTYSNPLFKCDNSIEKETLSFDQTEQSCISRNDTSFVTANSSSSSTDTRFYNNFLCDEPSYNNSHTDQIKGKRLVLIHEKLKSLLQSYIHMVKIYRPLLHLVESSISKLLLYYTPTFDATEANLQSSNVSYLQSEISFVFLNLLSFTNNVIYYGIGFHQSGFTFANNFNLELKNAGKMKFSLALVLCSLLSGIDCIQPAVEYIGIMSNLRNQLPYHCYYPRMNHQRKKSEMIQDNHPWNTIVHLEMIKLILRAALLIHYHYNYFFAEEKKIRIMKYIPCGILEAGGVFFPGDNDDISSSSHLAKLLNEKLNHERYEARRETSMNGYIGRRTGWNGITISQKNKNRINTKSVKDANNIRKKKAPTQFQKMCEKWMQVLNGIISSRCMIQCLMITGDLLHILRPLYYARLQLQYHHFLTKAKYQNTYRSTKRQFETISPLRSWIISLLMDLISQKMIHVGLHLSKSNNSKQFDRTDPMHTRITKELTFVSRRTNDELLRRKQRLILYLLRSPIWYTITEPVLLRFVDNILGIRIGQYIRGIALYWQQHHFMLD